MYAVIEVGGKQQRVQVGDVVRVESLAGDDGDSVVFDSVLAVGAGDSLRVGTPTIEGASVRATLVGRGRGPKIVTYLFKRRKNASRRRRGHRQDFSTVRIEAIEA
jgi:large subunit ribosomal protein L21